MDHFTFRYGSTDSFPLHWLLHHQHVANILQVWGFENLSGRQA